ncbi:hypothetical protein HK101_001080 [Irineochytrium annulatum]|nr:hypothetical protein HK101_001080 [Irineochytrium annulatum]
MVVSSRTASSHDLADIQEGSPHHRGNGKSADADDKRKKAAISTSEARREQAITLLRSGVLLTSNEKPTGPLEAFLHINNRPCAQSSTYTTLQPVRFRPLPIPNRCPPEDPAQYGYGLFYVPPFTNEHPILTADSGDDEAVAPLNGDPCRDDAHNTREQPMPGYESEPNGTRWMLQNLRCGPPVRLPDIYRRAGARKIRSHEDVAELRKEMNDRSEMSSRRVRGFMMTERIERGRAKTAIANATIPGSLLLNHGRTLGFSPTGLMSEPLPGTASRRRTAAVHGSRGNAGRGASAGATDFKTGGVFDDDATVTKKSGSLGDGEGLFPRMHTSFAEKKPKTRGRLF